MKKFTLFVALFAILFSVAAKAQTFKTASGDTVKAYWATTGTTVDVVNNIVNLSSSPIKIKWEFVSFSTAPGWVFEGFCDNKSCYGGTGTPDSVDIVSGTMSKISDTVKRSGGMGLMKMLVNGDAAAINTATYATLRFTDIASGDDTTATYVAMKKSTNVVTVSKVEDVTIFPNPAQNYIDVLYTSGADVKNIAIYNLIGKLVSVYKVSSNTSAHCEFNAEMPSGIYLLRVSDSKGNIVATRKFTRQ